MRIITQFKPNMTFQDYFKSLKPGDVFMFKNNPLIYMVAYEPETGRKLFVSQLGTICNPCFYKRELLVILWREPHSPFDSLSTIYSRLNYMF